MASSHTLLKALYSTTEASCQDTLNVALERGKKGLPLSVAQYGVTSKNLAVFDNVANGTFVRKNLSRDSVEIARQAVLHGTRLMLSPPSSTSPRARRT